MATLYDTTTLLWLNLSSQGLGLGEARNLEGSDLWESWLGELKFFLS